MPRNNIKTFRETYKDEYAKNYQKIKKSASRFGLNLIHGEYKARIVLFIASIAVLIGLSIIPLYLSGLVEKAEARKSLLISELSKQNDVWQYERNIAISSEPVDNAQKAAEEVAIIQNKYIIAVLEDVEVTADIDRELELANYLRDERERSSWFNMRDRETLKSAFTAGDYYWAGCADHALTASATDFIPTFFILYDSYYPVQIIEYKYDVKNDDLIYQKNWG